MPTTTPSTLPLPILGPDYRAWLPSHKVFGGETDAGMIQCDTRLFLEECIQRRHQRTMMMHFSDQDPSVLGVNPGNNK